MVLALHGFAEHAGVFAPVGEALAANGTAVYAYDQRGFGDTAFRGVWPGSDPLIRDARTAFRLLRKRYPDREIHLLGESMGGAIAVLAGQGQAIEPASLLLLAPALWNDEAMPWYQRTALWLGDRLVPGLEVDRTTARDLAGVQPTNDPATLRAMQNDDLMLSDIRTDLVAGVAELMDRAAGAARIPAPALLLYGLNDQIVPPRAMCATLRRISKQPGPRPTVVLYPHGYHLLTRDLQAHFPLADLTDWLGNPGSPLLTSRETALDVASDHICDQAQAAIGLTPRPRSVGP